MSDRRKKRGIQEKGNGSRERPSRGIQKGDGRRERQEEEDRIDE